MESELFSQYTPAIHNFSGDPRHTSLLLAAEGSLTVHYAPFDCVNTQARVVLVGITPGKTQAVTALAEARQQLRQGATPSQALLRAKQTGAFAGPMRANLIAMLDHIGLAQWLELSSCASLFGASANLLQSASVLPFPVFVDGDNYNGSPDIVRTPLLQRMLLEHFVPMARQVADAVFVPLGPVPSKALDWLVQQGALNGRQVLHGFPHPSAANSERIAYFLGRKQAAQLSAKTSPAKLDEARLQLVRAVAAL